MDGGELSLVFVGDKVSGLGEEDGSCDAVSTSGSRGESSCGENVGGKDGALDSAALLLQASESTEA